MNWASSRALPRTVKTHRMKSSENEGLHDFVGSVAESKRWQRQHCQEEGKEREEEGACDW